VGEFACSYTLLRVHVARIAIDCTYSHQQDYSHQKDAIRVDKRKRGLPRRAARGGPALARGTLANIDRERRHQAAAH